MSPGWYPDPAAPRALRWWTGRGWSTYRRSAPRRMSGWTIFLVSNPVGWSILFLMLLAAPFTRGYRCWR